MNPVIAPAESGDETDVVALWQSAGLTRPWNDAGADFRRALATSGSTVLVARLGAALAGAVMVGDDGHRGWVYYLGVDPAHRGKGLGRALMSAAEAWLRDRDCPKIMLMVRSDNLAAKGFYDALGYEDNAVVTMGRRLDGR